MRYVECGERRQGKTSLGGGRFSEYVRGMGAASKPPLPALPPIVRHSRLSSTVAVHDVGIDILTRIQRHALNGTDACNYKMAQQVRPKRHARACVPACLHTCARALSMQRSFW
jgi:hypothetical protein